MLDMLEVERLRRDEFAALDGAAYLNAASVGPLPERTRAAIEEYLRRQSRAQVLDEADFAAPLRRCRAAAARLLGCDADEIALGGNTSYGINLAALGLPLAPGSTILTSEGEFPANVYPWMAQQARDIRFEALPRDARGLPDEERLLARLDGGDVSVLALSTVQFGTGFRADVARFGGACRERGIYFVVDAIQACGCLPAEVRTAQVDVLATGGQKWLCGPLGTGFAYVRRELHEELVPRVVGWTAMRASRDLEQLTDYRWEFLPGARRYEVATPSFQNVLGLAHSLELLLEVGIERIEAQVLSLLDPLIGWLRERPDVEIVSALEPARRSGILSFRTPAPKAVFAALGEAGVVCAYREGALRVSPHLYNQPADIERLIEVLTDQERKGWSESRD
jgi:cysteine desulfurase / selenocysteine lyase